MNNERASMHYKMIWNAEIKTASHMGYQGTEEVTMAQTLVVVFWNNKGVATAGVFVMHSLFVRLLLLSRPLTKRSDLNFVPDNNLELSLSCTPRTWRVHVLSLDCTTSKAEKFFHKQTTTLLSVVRETKINHHLSVWKVIIYQGLLHSI